MEFKAVSKIPEVKVTLIETVDDVRTFARMHGYSRVTILESMWGGESRVEQVVLEGAPQTARTPLLNLYLDYYIIEDLDEKGRERIRVINEETFNRYYDKVESDD